PRAGPPQRTRVAHGPATAQENVRHLAAPPSNLPATLNGKAPSWQAHPAARLNSLFAPCDYGLRKVRGTGKMLRADSPIEDACRPRRWRIALAVVAGALLGLAFALVMPARYEAGAELLVDAGEDPALAAARMDSLMRIAASGRVIDRLVA